MVIDGEGGKGSDGNRWRDGRVVHIESQHHRTSIASEPNSRKC